MNFDPKEKAIFENRLFELAERSYMKGLYTFTPFLSLAEQSVCEENRAGISYASPSYFGGTEYAERRILRFGNADTFGYEEQFPISVICVTPHAGDFARELSHRDFLGSVLNLGLDRSVIGDILIDREKNRGYIFCLSHIADFICESLERVKNEKVRCELFDIASLPDGIEPKTEECRLSVSSPRLDGVVAAVYNLSRSDAQDTVRAGLVFVNGRLCEDLSHTLTEGDLVSIRGKGRFIYRGVNYVSRRGRDNITVERFI